MFTRSIRHHAAAGTLLFGMAMAAPAGAAIIDASIGGGPDAAPDAAGVVYENFDGLGAGNAGGLTGSGIEVNFTGSGQAVTGSFNGQYAAPYISGGNGALFGNNQADGPNATQYLSTGIGTVELLLNDDYEYFGMLWGSVDSYNTLEFFNDDTSLFSFSGVDVDALANGDQGANGTFYVNISSDVAFNRVVASSPSYAFEFDNVALGTGDTGPNGSEISEPGALAVMSLGLLGIGFAARRRRKP